MALIDVVTKNQDAALTASEFNQFLEALKTAARGINTLDVKSSTATFTGAVNFLSTVTINGEEGPYQKFWETQNVLYVSKGGGVYNGTTYNGKSPDKALSSFQNAIDNIEEAFGTPSATNLIGIVCNDSGIYEESIITKDWVSISAPLATVKLGGVGSKQLIIKNCSVEFHNITRISGTNDMIVFSATGGDGHLRVDSIKDYGSGASVSQSTTTPAFLEANIMIQYGGGKCISDDTATASHLHVLINAMYLYSNNAIGVYKSRPGSIAGFITEIANSGVETGTTGIYCSDGTVKLSLIELETNIAYNVSNIGNMTIYVNELQGTEINTATASVVTPEILSNALEEIEGKEDYLGIPGLDGQVLSSLTNGIRSWITPGNMLKIIYDPTNKNADAFKHENHYGASLDFEIDAIDPAYQEGRLSWNNNDNTLNVDTGISATTIQVGQELLIRVHNNTGLSLQDGKVVYMDDTFTSGVPNCQLAIATEISNLETLLAVTTGVISPGQDGFATIKGKVRNLNTSNCTTGSCYLSGTTAGDMTSIAPAFPAYKILIGGVLVSDISEGVLYVSIDGTPADTIHNYWNGTIREPLDFIVTSNGAVITGTLQKTDGGDLTMHFSDGHTMLDCTPPKTITLTPGTITVPAKNYVYIPKSTKVLTVSTSDWPAEEHIRIADIVLQSATYTQTYGPLSNRNWNEDVQESNGQGDASHIGAWIRNRPASWYSGCQGTLNLVNSTTLYFSNTSGKVFQKHLQNFDAHSQPTTPMFIVNHPTSPYTINTNLATISLTSTNTALLNTRYNIVIWGVNSKSSQPDQLMINLSRGSYPTSDADAINDVLNYSDYSIPALYNGTGFLIARATLRNQSGAISILNVTDLRGVNPGSVSAGGYGGPTTILALTDTPASYAGKAGDVLVVNPTETAMEFLSGVNGSFTSLDGKTITVTNGIITSII